MKTSLLRLTAVLILLLPSALHAQAIPSADSTFQIPVARMTHELRLRQRMPGGNITNEALTPGVVINNASGTPAYRTFTGQISNERLQYWVEDYGVQPVAVSPSNQRGLVNAMWRNIFETQTVFFALPKARLDHVFSLFQPGGATYLLTNGALQGYYEGQTLQDYGFFDAWSLFDRTKPYALIDHSEREQSVWNTSNLLGLPWAPYYGPTPITAVTMRVPASDEARVFTLHVGEAAQTLRAAIGVSYDSQGQLVPDLFATVTGSAGLGMRYQLVREAIDPLTNDWTTLYSPFVYARPGQVHDWSSGSVFPDLGPVPRSLSGVTFTICGNQYGRQFAVHHQDGFRVAVSVGNSYPNYATAQDYNGYPIDAQYGEVTVDLDTSQPWSLIDESSGTDLGHVTQVWGGWPGNSMGTPAAGTINLQINAGRYGHILKVRLSDDSLWDIQELSYGQSFVTYTRADGSSYDIGYYSFTAPSPTSHPAVALVDQSAMDEVSIDSSGNHMLWFPPLQPLFLQISETRWNHTLWLVHLNGEAYPVQRGNIQGVWSQDSSGRAWFSGYGLFDATVEHNPGLSWVIKDHTTEEVLYDVYQLRDQYASDATSDADSDGLQDWYEAILGTNPNLSDSDYDGWDDFTEVRLGRNPMSFAEATDPTHLQLNIVTPNN